MLPDLGKQWQRFRGIAEPDLEHRKVGECVAMQALVLEVATRSYGVVESGTRGLEVAELDFNQWNVARGSRRSRTISISLCRRHSRIELHERVCVAPLVPGQQSQSVERFGQLCVEAQVPLHPDCHFTIATRILEVAKVPLSKAEPHPRSRFSDTVTGFL